MSTYNARYRRFLAERGLEDNSAAGDLFDEYDDEQHRLQNEREDKLSQGNANDIAGLIAASLMFSTIRPASVEDVTDFAGSFSAWLTLRTAARAAE